MAVKVPPLHSASQIQLAVAVEVCEHNCPMAKATNRTCCASVSAWSCASGKQDGALPPGRPRKSGSPIGPKQSPITVAGAIRRRFTLAWGRAANVVSLDGADSQAAIETLIEVALIVAERSLAEAATRLAP
jgi:hypothetical protein